jgi:hypothetical protein
VVFCCAPRWGFQDPPGPRRVLLPGGAHYLFGSSRDIAAHSAHGQTGIAGGGVFRQAACRQPCERRCDAVWRGGRGIRSRDVTRLLRLWSNIGQVTRKSASVINTDAVCSPVQQRPTLRSATHKSTNARRGRAWQGRCVVQIKPENAQTITQARNAALANERIIPMEMIASGPSCANRRRLRGMEDWLMTTHANCACKVRVE